MNLPSSLVLLGAALALGCGAPSSGPGLAFELFVDRALVDELGAFQVVVLPNGRARNCAELQSTCLNQQVKADEPLLLSDRAGGKQARAVRFPAGLASGAQKVEIDLPVGRNYVVVIEALSKATPPRFLGSSCNYLDSVSATNNDPLITAPITLAATACDPTFAP